MSENPITPAPEQSDKLVRVYNEYSVMYSRLTERLIDDLMRKHGLSYEDAKERALALTVSGARDTADFLNTARPSDTQEDAP